MCRFHSALGQFHPSPALAKSLMASASSNRAAMVVGLKTPTPEPRKHSPQNLLHVLYGKYIRTDKTKGLPSSMSNISRKQTASFFSPSALHSSMASLMTTCSWLVALPSGHMRLRIVQRCGSNTARTFSCTLWVPTARGASRLGRTPFLAGTTGW